MNSQVQRSKTITLSRPLKQVFPMFQPEGEKSWTANWDPQYVWPSDGQPREGLVFTHDNGKGGQSIWTMTRFDEQDHHIEYTVVAPGSHVTQIRIRCEQARPDQTEASVCYTVTPISEEGLAVLEQFAPGDYDKRISVWQLPMEHFFATGEASDVH
jgi:hypothetical protein